jgi:hypothetical protein
MIPLWFKAVCIQPCNEQRMCRLLFIGFTAWGKGECKNTDTRWQILNTVRRATTLFREKSAFRTGTSLALPNSIPAKGFE